MNLYKHGITQKRLVRSLGVSQEFRKHKDITWHRTSKGRNHLRWTWDRVVDTAIRVAREQGFLPPAAWFQRQSLGSLVGAVYASGHTWEELRAETGAPHNKNFVKSRSGSRWRSHPEASLSNFLHARAILHKYGRKYPADYSRLSGYAYAYYDLRFLSKNGTWIDVEVWGDKPHGHQQEKYAAKRAAKEQYNAGRDAFVGIHFVECYSEEALSSILEPHIGIIAPSVFDSPTDRVLPSTHWSNADELLESCRDLLRTLPSDRFPTEDWLRKRGRFRSRPGPAYNTMAIYIRTWLGGFRQLRQLLGQPENSTRQWTRESVLEAYKEWFAKYRRTPSAMRKAHEEGRLRLSDGELKRAGNIAHAAQKYVGNTVTVHRLLGLPAPRRSPRR